MTYNFNAQHSATVASIAAVLDEYLCPDRLFAMGESERFLLGEAQTVMTRRGNATGVPCNAQTFDVEFIHPDFHASVRCVWEGRYLYQPIWSHVVTSLLPDTEQAQEAFTSWLKMF